MGWSAGSSQKATRAQWVLYQELLDRAPCASAGRTELGDVLSVQGSQFGCLMASFGQFFISLPDSWESERWSGFLKIQPGWGLWLEQNLGQWL